ncbi:MAG: hypothetical protein H7321_08485 [Bacteroidia bacterium]|nr:hypothetical protein [Bacteroidia bacterium]
MNKRFILAVSLMTVAIISLQSCRKNDDKADTQEVITSAEDNSTVETEFTSAFDVADDISSNDSRSRGSNTILPGGAILNFSDSSFNDGDGIEFSVDFGPLGTSVPKGMVCNDGRYRAGVLHFTATKRYSVDSAIITAEASASDNYYAGNGDIMTKLSGMITITRLSAVGVNVKVTNAKAINDRGTITWQSNRTIVKTFGANTPGILNDEFEVTGSASGVNRNNEAFTVTIDKALKKRVSAGCASTFISGRLTLTNTSSGKVLKIEYDPYSNEACDKVAKATINNKEYIFIVR